MTEPTTKTYYKVLRRDPSGTLHSCHGSTMAWPAPTADGPGEWLPPVKPRMCSTGYHLTTDPARWFDAADRVVFAVEHDGEMVSDGGDKVSVEMCRLVRELTHAELAELRIFVSGSHEAFGSASVTACDSASVRAFGSASVTAYDSASVRACGSASVTAYDSASVTAFNSASVRAFGSASVTAYDSASVTVYDSASVRASGKSMCQLHWRAAATLWEQATAVAFGQSAFVAHGTSAVIDRRGDVVAVVVGDGAVELK